jgi:putative glutamine amidotransferase
MPIPDHPDGIGPVLGAVDGVLVTGELRDPDSDESRREAELIQTALDRDLPILAIDGGCLFLNQALGGQCCDDLATTCRAIDHQQGNLPGNLPWHSLKVDAWSCLATFLGTSKLDVNSFHRGAIVKPGVGLAAVAWSEDGVIEAVESKAHNFVLGVQFHPELMSGNHVRLFWAFRRSAESYRQRRRKRASLT